MQQWQQQGRAALNKRKNRTDVRDSLKAGSQTPSSCMSAFGSLKKYFSVLLQELIFQSISQSALLLWHIFKKKLQGSQGAVHLYIKTHLDLG